MNIGRAASFNAAGKKWNVKPFSIDIWFAFTEWLKSLPKTYDPLERVSKLPLEKLPQEAAERLVREAIDEDRQLHDFRPESEATKRALQSLDGIIKIISLLSGESDADVKTMVMSLAAEGKLDVLTNAIQQTIGEVEKKVTA